MHCAHPIDPRTRQGVDLEKQLLACLKELSRAFNDGALLELYQAEALKAASGQGGGGRSDQERGGKRRHHDLGKP